MTPSSPGDRPRHRAAEEVLRRVLPEPPADHEAPQSPAPPSGVDERRQALLDEIGAPDRESW